MTGAQESLLLHGGVIAAGHGTRLRADGYRVSKPMTPVDGRPLIGHALDRFRAAGIRRASIVINEGSDDCRHWLSEHDRDLDLDIIVRTTPSSYASFRDYRRPTCRRSRAHHHRRCDHAGGRLSAFYKLGRELAQ